MRKGGAGSSPFDSSAGAKAGKVYSRRSGLGIKRLLQSKNVITTEKASSTPHPKHALPLQH